MALITCLNCGGQISDKAFKCPHCDIKLKKKTSVNPGVILQIVGIFAIAVILALAIGDEWLNLADRYNDVLLYQSSLIVIMFSFLFLIPVILFIIAFFTSKTKNVKYLSLLLVFGWVAFSIYWVDFSYRYNFLPAIEFEKNYVNANALKELKGKKIENFNGEYLSFKGDNVEIGNRDGVIATVPVIHVDSKGNMTTDLIKDNTNNLSYLVIEPYAFSGHGLEGSSMGFRAEIYSSDMNYWNFDSYANKNKKKGDFGIVGRWFNLEFIDIDK